MSQFPQTDWKNQTSRRFSHEVSSLRLLLQNLCKQIDEEDRGGEETDGEAKEYALYAPIKPEAHNIACWKANEQIAHTCQIGRASCRERV